MLSSTLDSWDHSITRGRHLFDRAHPRRDQPDGERAADRMVRPIPNDT